MKQVIIALLTLTTFSTLAQDTKKVKEKHENPWYTEEYYVLKSDKNVRHGNYKKLGYKDCLVIDGYYKNNKKDSTWTEYFWRTDIIERQGNYKDNKKTGLWTEYHRIGKKNTPANKGEYKEGERIGIWEFYNRETELIQKYNYDIKDLTYFKPAKETDQEYEVKTTNGIEKKKLDRPPVYIGGQDEAAETLFDAQIRYPNEAKNAGISGTVWISFFIDVDGQAIDHQVQEGIGGGCDEEALRVVKEIPNNWLPGQLNGQAVTAKYSFPVKFTLR